MAKLLRFVLEGLCYHVITTTRDRTPILDDPANACIVEQALQFLRRERAYVVAYVIMPDHLHAVLVPKAGYTISQVMQTVKGYTARLINQRRGSRGPLWQPSFYDRVIRDEQQLLEAVNYVHMNPVAAGLVADPETYPFSSAAREEHVDLAQFL